MRLSAGYVAAQSLKECSAPAGFSHFLPAKQRFLRVGDAGIEPAISAVWRQYDGLLDVSEACKIAANIGI